MTYEEKLNTLEYFSMEIFIKVSKELLPPQYRINPWQYVGHGVGLLSTDEQLYAYIAAYGEMHQVKCRASFQNFDFDSLSTNFEVIDWGCGQGVGVLAFIDMLRERDKLNLLKKATLIEPSLSALKRAKTNIEKATNGTIQLLPINKYLPGNNIHEEITGIDYTYSNVIHIFSNILDIETINLKTLASMVAIPEHTHYIMCMGPKNTNFFRLDKFCSVFSINTDSYISHIDNANYGRTSDTNHIFSCVTRCFKYSGEGISFNNMRKFVAPTLICGHPIYDDYDPMLAVQNNVISKDLSDLYTYIGEILNPTDQVYLKPLINGDTPDIIILRPNTGIMVIKVFEEDITQYKFETNDNTITDGRKDISSPIVIVQSYQQNLIQLHLKDMLGKSLINSSYWSVIKTVVYCSKNSTSEVKEFFNDAKIGYTVVLGKDIINTDSFNFLKETHFDYSSHYFDKSICRSFLRIISPLWHSYKQGKHINLTTQQKRIAKSEQSPRRKVNGVAGSGKTQVLATRAVNANLRTGNKVLVLTFNLSLVNYIKYRIYQVRADFSWDMFLIVNYHQLFIAEANNLGLKMNLSSFEDTKFFDRFADKIKKYPTILIDEVQDYKTAWLSILDKYFLEPEGEIAVFGDAKQNIYHRPLDQNGQVRIGFIAGEWNNSLNTGFRFANAQLTSMAMDFQRYYFPKLATDFIQQEATLAFDTNIKYYNVGKTGTPETLESNCRWIMQEFHIVPKDVVILAQTCNILRDIDYIYKMTSHAETITTFESKEQYDKLKARYQTTDDKTKFWKNIKQIRRNKKIHFTMDNHNIKLSTIHSYKGWESPTVILLLEPEQYREETSCTITVEDNSSELIYTAITRCKENLFIINCGNTKYHNFFNDFCNR